MHPNRSREKRNIRNISSAHPPSPPHLSTYDNFIVISLILFIILHFFYPTKFDFLLLIVLWRLEVITMIVFLSQKIFFIFDIFDIFYDVCVVRGPWVLRSVLPILPILPILSKLSILSILFLFLYITNWSRLRAGKPWTVRNHTGQFLMLLGGPVGRTNKLFILHIDIFLVFVVFADFVVFCCFSFYLLGSWFCYVFW